MINQREELRIWRSSTANWETNRRKKLSFLITNYEKIRKWLSVTAINTVVLYWLSARVWLRAFCLSIIRRADLVQLRTPVEAIGNLKISVVTYPTTSALENCGSQNKCVLRRISNLPTRWCSNKFCQTHSAWFSGKDQILRIQPSGRQTPNQAWLIRPSWDALSLFPVYPTTASFSFCETSTGGSTKSSKESCVRPLPTFTPKVLQIWAGNWKFSIEMNRKESYRGEGVSKKLVSYWKVENQVQGRKVQKIK